MSQTVPNANPKVPAALPNFSGSHPTQPSLQALSQAVVDGFAAVSGGAGKAIASGTATFTGTDTNIDTGLSVIDTVEISVKATTQGAGEAAYVTYDHGADGLLDVYAWDDAGAAATVACTVSWTAKGTQA